MELIDPNKNPEDVRDLKLSEKDLRDLSAKFKTIQMDIAQQVAFFELGISTYLNEQSLIDSYNITREQLELFKKSNRRKIERFKEEHKYGKFKVVQSIGKRMALADAMTEAALEGNATLASSLERILINAEKVMPVSNLESMAKILVSMDDKEAITDRNHTNIQINVNPAVQEAQRSLDERRRQKITELNDAARVEDKKL